MDYLWTPWRYAYVSNASRIEGCIFCELPKRSDEEAFIIHRAEHCFILLNSFPYTSGHVMIVPYEHLDQLQKVSRVSAQEMMSLAQKMEGVLRDAYNPDGINLGMNLGAAAGAGVAGHVHLHMLPRWIADANFMTTVGETRVLPEDLKTTWKRLREGWRSKA